MEKLPPQAISLENRKAQRKDISLKIDCFRLVSRDLSVDPATRKLSEKRLRLAIKQRKTLNTFLKA